MRYDHIYMERRFPKAYGRGRLDKCRGIKNNVYPEPGLSVKMDNQPTEWYAYEAAHEDTEHGANMILRYIDHENRRYALALGIHP